ncbi:MAG: alginate lyase family protein [Bacteroidales bacterium]|nr:alginate lyase family protein [Bacteroidales bacterium]MCB8999306.1 alginate lyase family protein [Bacteroidales bacterium]MCB9012438.1 alginate lyase family protein [Bacteroidales bacterium]
MNKRILTYSFPIIVLLSLVSCTQAKPKSEGNKEHPLLILRKNDVPEIQKGIKNFPLLHASFEEAKEIADKAIESGIIVPFPKDPGGGYSHEKHKQNYIDMYNAGLVYQITKEDKYAIFVRDMLLEYQKMYPGLGLHPMRKNQSPGKLFWQGLNESVWLVYTIQAYDCVYDFISPENRKLIEDNLFRKMVNFFTVEDNYTFNRLHNHGTWSVAGVGMTGMVLGDSLMIKEALYSTKLDGSGGFLRQIDELFSPDGYYAEGPYYQRYAIMPFMLFAQAIQNNLPDLKIFDYRDSVLAKSVNMVLQLTNTDGRFYPINDAIKEKTWITPEMVYATNIIYAQTGDKNLLFAAEKQGEVMISSEGLKLAKSIAENPVPEFVRKSMIIHDGKDGKEGGLALLRLGKAENQSSVLFKFATQGMGHGHFDRLEFIMYDKGREIIPDYGSARFLNVVAKEGGRYLDENNSWSKQTVAHNTLVLDEKSDFNGKLDKAEAHSPDLIFSDLENSKLQIVSASDSNCYPDAVLNRTLAFFELDGRRYLVDLFNVKNKNISRYDLPVYFNGELIDFNFPYNRLTDYQILGKGNGYQHLIVDAKASDLPSTARISWMNGKGFYTLSSLTDPGTEFNIVRLGANDPKYNLRDQYGMMLRFPKMKDAKFLNVYEIHGNYNPSSESVLQSEGSVKNMELIQGLDDKVLINIELKDGRFIKLLLDLNYKNSSSNEIQYNEKSFSWSGNYKLLIEN